MVNLRTAIKKVALNKVELSYQLGGDPTACKDCVAKFLDKGSYIYPRTQVCLSFLPFTILSPYYSGSQNCPNVLLFWKDGHGGKQWNKQKIRKLHMIC